KTFVTTRATQALETSIDQNNVTLIKGPPGSGKTANAHHIALKYKQKGYQIFNVQSIEKIFDLWMQEGSQLFVLDDIFGIHKADESELHRWKKCKEDLTFMFDNSCIKILATIRSYIHQDALLEFLEYQAVDISSSDISLTNEEREEMFSKYSSYQERDDLSGLALVRFTAEKISNYSIEDFFNKPLSELIGKELQDFSVNEKVRYFCLLYCMMNDNCIEVDMVSLADKEDKTKTVRENLLKICKLPVSLPVTEIKSKLDTLLNTYLKREGDTYQFIHDIVHDAIVQHVNQLPLEIKRLILKHSTPNFIKDRTHLGSIDKSASQAAIVITKDLEDAWGDCELNCIKEGHWNEVFENTCIRTKQADEILTRSLNRLGDRSIKKFANNCKGKLDKRVLSVKLLSEYTLSIESKLSGEDCTILHFSVLLGLLDFTKSLLRFINVFKKHVINHHLNLLLLACLSGNVEMVLLFKKYGLNKYSSGKLTPLFLSSGLGNDVIVKTLIEYGSSVNTRNTVQKQTPLFIASRYGHDKVVKLLIKSGAAINKSDSDGNSALHIACLQSYADIVKLLIEAGVDVKKPNRHGDSALSSACLNSTTDMVRLLIEAGMDVKNPNSDGDSALYMACLNSNTDMVRLLIEAGMDVKNPNIDGYSALSMACMNNNTDLVKLLIEAGVDVKKPNSDGDSALYLACFNRNADIVRLLIEAGMDVKNPNSDGYSALSIACLGSDADIVKLLIDAGVDVNKSDRLGDSALHTACRQSNADIVKLLIKAGVDANKPDSDGNSALYIACRHSNPDIVNLLIEAGVDVTKSDEPKTGWNNLPASTDNSPGAQIARIKYYRNTIAHTPTCSISKNDFTKSWQEVSQALETSIDQNNVTLIKGPPGSGKTANAHHIDLRYKQKGYQVFNVQSIEKIVDFWMPEGSQLFVLDDIFGIHKADESELHRWKKCKEDLTLMFDNSCIKILATVRSYIHQDELLEFLQYQAVDISSSDISLTNEEREEMFSKYSSYQERDDLSGFGTRVKDYNIYCFPLLCRRFTAEKISKHSIEDFFNKPLSELIGKELQDFSVNEKVRYFCLLYCMMNDNCIEVDMVSLADKEEKTKTVREILLKICKLRASLPVTEIKSKLDTLLNTYLKREGDTYQFIHDIVHDAVVQHVNHLPLKIQRLLLEHSPPNFIKDRTHLGSIDRKSKLSGEDCTILHFSVLLGLLDFTKSLLRFINIFKKYVINCHLNLLLLACLSGNVEMVSFFKKYGLNKYSSGMLTPLFLSSGIGNNVIVKTLIEYGSSVNTRNTVLKQTPLQIASRYGHYKVVEVLIKSGAAINKSDSDGNSALHIACCHSNADIVKLLIEAGVDVNKSDSDGNSALHTLCFDSNVDIVKLLIEAGVDVNKSDSNGFSALHIACWQSNADIVKLLIEAGVDVNKSDSDGYSALYIACRHSNADIVKLLIEAGVDVNKFDSDGNSALDAACWQSNADIVKLLIEAGVDVNKSDSDGYSALYIACRHCNADIVKLLIEAGVDVNKSDSDGNSALHTVCYDSNVDIVKLLIEAGVDVNKSDSNGFSALHIACWQSNADIVKLLIEAGVDVNRSDSDGNSALHKVCFDSNGDIVKLLIEAGVDVNKSDSDGNSA
ncbi:hypothetical protein KUTeg_015343, partial [Tegillarca granosa]